MNLKYVCPHCRNSVNLGDDVMLIGKTGTGLRGIVVLSAEPGNYTAKFSDDITVTEGNRLNLSCPICHKKLSRWRNKNLAMLLLVDDDKVERKIYFSQIVGQNCTYIIEGRNLKQSFGEHTGQYAIEKLLK
jgi:hypothetical protein